MTNMKFSAHAHSENQTRSVVTTDNFKLIVDEPEQMGGTNAGPTPVDYILVALSGCLNVVGHAIAAEMGFTLKGMDIDVEGDLNPSKFMGQDVETRAGYSNILVKVTPDSDADEKTLESWVKKLETRCPVSDNILHTTPMNIVLS